MADEVLVEVKDRVPRSIKVSFDEISTSADKAQGRVDSLQRSMDRLKAMNSARLGRENNVSQMNAQTAATERQIRAMQRESQAYQRNAQAIERARSQEIRANERAAAAKERASARIVKAAEREARAQSPGWGRAAGIGAAVGGGVGGISGGLRGAASGAIASGNPYAAAAGAGYLAFDMTAGANLKYTDQYAGLQNSLKNVTGSVETTGIALIELNSIANDTRAPIGAVAEGYARFNRALAPLGKTQAETAEFQRTLNTMLFQYGKTSTEASSATLQLTQAMGKGKLDGDEFRSVMENLPELAQAIAQELGVTKGELIELAPQGKITGDVIYNAMMHAKDGLSQLPEPVVRIDGVMTKLDNSATLFFGNLDQNTHIVGTLIGWLDNLADSIGGVSEKMARHNALKINLGTESDVRRFMGVADDAALTAEQTIRLRELSKEWHNYQAARGAGVESAENDSIRLLAALQKEKEGYEKVRAEAIAKGLQADKARESDNQAEALIEKRIGNLKQEIKIGGMKARDAYIARGMQSFQNELEKQELQLSTEQLKRSEDISKELGRQFDQQEKLNGSKKVQLTLLERIAEANKTFAETPAHGYVANENAPRGELVSEREDARLERLLGIDQAWSTDGQFGARGVGKGNAMHDNFYEESGEKVDIEAIRAENRKKREEERAARDPYKVKKDLDKRIDQLGEYGTDSEFQIKAREDLNKRIAELNREGLLNEQEVSNAKIRIWQAEQKNKLDLASTFFDNFTGLMRSENKEVAAIGKAAAIASAIVNTYSAANAAFAAMAGIPIVGPALGAAAAAGAIASGMINVGEIANAPTGFQQGGYTGSGSVSAPAGVVHGQEYVIDAANTARIGRGNLDALRSGSAAVGSAGSSVGTPLSVTLILVNSQQEAAAIASPAGETFVLNVIADHPQQINLMLKNAS